MLPAARITLRAVKPELRAELADQSVAAALRRRRRALRMKVADVAAHYFGEVPHGATALSFGWLGVGVFFALSGYLIGSIILDGRDQPGFTQQFYFRRSVQIIPVYLVTVLGALFALNIFCSEPWAVPAFSLPVYLTFTQNFAVAFHGEGNVWLLPTWTLAVSENRRHQMVELTG